MTCGDKKYLCLKDVEKKKNGASCKADSECTSGCCKYPGKTCGDKKYMCLKDVENKKKKNGASCKGDSECESNCCSYVYDKCDTKRKFVYCYKEMGKN